jgi:hypothetical protein
MEVTQEFSCPEILGSLKGQAQAISKILCLKSPDAVKKIFEYQTRILTGCTTSLFSALISKRQAATWA